MHTQCVMGLSGSYARTTRCDGGGRVMGKTYTSEFVVILSDGEIGGQVHYREAEVLGMSRSTDHYGSIAGLA